MTTLDETGVGIGVETTRNYLAIDVASGARSTVERQLRSLVGRADIVRVWMKPIGSKVTVWEHHGPLLELPALDDLYTATDPAIAA